MKKLLLLCFFSAFMAFAVAQDTTTFSLTVYTYQDTMLWISGDYNQQCPDVANGMQGVPEAGFHSGANQWASVVAWDSTAALTGRNDSSDHFRVLVNPKQYWGVEMANLQSVFFLFTNGIGNPSDPWTDAMRDTVNGGFGGTDPCSDLKIFMDEVEPMPNTSFSVSGCVDTANNLLQIDFNYGKNCPEEGQGLSLESEMGFHSGANQWASVVAWDDPGAQTLINNGLDTFSVVIDPMAYYGVPMDSLVNIYFVGNNGPNDPNDPWAGGLTGRADAVNPVDDCSDLAIYMSDMGVCATALTKVDDLLLDINLRIAPNPFDQSTQINFTNLQNEVLDIELTNMNGQTVRSIQNFRGNELLIERNELSTGLYFLTIRNQEGKFAMEKLMIK